MKPSLYSKLVNRMKKNTRGRKTKKVQTVEEKEWVLTELDKKKRSEARERAVKEVEKLSSAASSSLEVKPEPSDSENTCMICFAEIPVGELFQEDVEIKCCPAKFCNHCMDDYMERQKRVYGRQNHEMTCPHCRTELNTSTYTLILDPIDGMPSYMNFVGFSKRKPISTFRHYVDGNLHFATNDIWELGNTIAFAYYKEFFGIDNPLDAYRIGLVDELVRKYNVPNRSGEMDVTYRFHIGELDGLYYHIMLKFNNSSFECCSYGSFAVKYGFTTIASGNLSQPHGATFGDLRYSSKFRNIVNKLFHLIDNAFKPSPEHNYTVILKEEFRSMFDIY